MRMTVLTTNGPAVYDTDDVHLPGHTALSFGVRVDPSGALNVEAVCRNDATRAEVSFPVAILGPSFWLLVELVDVGVSMADGLGRAGPA